MMFGGKRRLTALLVTALVAGLGLVGIGAPAQASATGWRYIRNPGNGKCIDNATENALKIQIWTCVNGNPNDPLPEGTEQQWDIIPSHDIYGRPDYQIRNRLSGRCLLSNGFLTPTDVLGDRCDRAEAGWKVIYENKDSVGWYQVLQSSVSGLCLDLKNNSATNGTVLQQYYCDLSFTNPAQKWRLGENLPFPEGVVVPSVMGLGEKLAASIMSSIGLKVVKSYINDCIAPGDVEVQDPFAGVTISPGAVAHLTISTCKGGGDPR